MSAKKYMIYFVAVLFFCCSESEKKNNHDKTMPLAEYFPASVEKGHWETKDVPRLYVGENLFKYINGGAEIYHEYGFSRVITWDYENDKGNNICAEIFEMESENSAFGIYTFKTSDDGIEVPFGSRGLLEGYYLNFLKGKYIVTLTAFDESEETVKGLSLLAELIDAKLMGTGNPPGIVNILPKENLINNSLKYFQGHLGLFNSYPFFTENVFAFQEAVKGKYNSGIYVYLFAYEDDNTCRDRLVAVRNKFSSDQKYSGLEKAGDTFYTRDSEGSLIYVETVKNYIVIVLGAENTMKSKTYVTAIRKNIAS